MNKIYVLMSTYNGEKYIRTQIESVLNQTDVEVSLFIRDDGSSDNTLNIIKELAVSDERITLFVGDNIGVKFSFLKLIELVDSKADYYAFCDQDDYWENRKLVEAVNYIDKKEICDKPILYYSHTTLVDENLNQLNIRNPYNCSREFQFGEIMIKNCASGCTMVFNRELKNIVNSGNQKNMLNTPLHDHWLYMICRAVGGIIVFDNRSFILYRQHSNNVIGANRNIIKKFMESPLLKKGNVRYSWALQLKDNYWSYISEENKRILNLIVSYKDSYVKTIRLALSGRIKPKPVLEKVVIFLTVLRRGF